ncbi:MAG: hypothetical protein ACYC2U_07475 [Candidatus Amoebophilus sp.]
MLEYIACWQGNNNSVTLQIILKGFKEKKLTGQGSFYNHTREGRRQELAIPRSPTTLLART